METLTGGCELLLCTFNARYAHASLGLRRLRAQLGPLRERCGLLELDLETRAIDAAARIIEAQPRLLGLGVYIWNVEQSRELLRLLRTLELPFLITLGGPELGYETEDGEWLKLADFIVRGEGELVFAELATACIEPPRALHKEELFECVKERLSTSCVVRKMQQSCAVEACVIDAEVVPVAQLSAVDEEYSDEDLARRVVYVESSRGCPYRCAFCMSALEKKLRFFPRDHTRESLERLWARGTRVFKFVDRSFNAVTDEALWLLEFFLPKLTEEEGLLHLECTPEQLDERLFALFRSFPAGRLQLELGVQTLNPEVAAHIQRPCHPERILHNLRRLLCETGAHLHTDLIVGLPGEDLHSLARGFDQLVAVEPHEIQVGILKRLRGAPLTAMTEHFGLRFSSTAPYEVLATDALPFEQLYPLRRFAKLWDKVYNSGHFPRSRRLLLRLDASDASAFAHFSAFVDFVEARHPLSRGIALMRLVELLFERLSVLYSPELAAAAVLDDYLGSGHNDVPRILRPYLDPLAQERVRERRAAQLSHAKRQARHLG